MSFNPRPRAGGDVIDIHKPQAADLFQSTPPRGGRPAMNRNDARGACVSIHAPAWGATPESTSTSDSTDCFNPRPRVGGDTQLVINRRCRFLVSIHAPARGATAPC